MKYLRVTSNEMMWGKHELTREYLASVATSGDALINLRDLTYFDSEANEWKPIPGDKVEEQ